MGGKDAIWSAYGRKTRKMRFMGIFAGFLGIIRILINTCFWPPEQRKLTFAALPAFGSTNKKIFAYDRKNGSRASDDAHLEARKFARRRGMNRVFAISKGVKPSLEGRGGGLIAASSRYEQ